VSEPGYPFTPSYQGTPGLLMGDVYSSIPVPRGQMDGTVVFPWGLEWAVSDYTSFRHTYSSTPLEVSLLSYTRGTTWFVDDESPASTMNWFQAMSVSPGGIEVNAVYFAKQSANEGPIQLMYQLTDDPSLHVTTSGLNTSIVLPGCASQDEPFVWDTTSMKRWGTYTYPSGALLDYYAVNVSAKVWDNGVYTDVVGGLGFIEVFTSS